MISEKNTNFDCEPHTTRELYVGDEKLHNINFGLPKKTPEILRKNNNITQNQPSKDSVLQNKIKFTEKIVNDKYESTFSTISRPQIFRSFTENKRYNMNEYDIQAAQNLISFSNDLKHLSENRQGSINNIDRFTIGSDDIHAASQFRTEQLLESDIEHMSSVFDEFLCDCKPFLEIQDTECKNGVICDKIKQNYSRKNGRVDIVSKNNATIGKGSYLCQKINKKNPRQNFDIVEINPEGQASELNALHRNDSPTRKSFFIPKNKSRFFEKETKNNESNNYDASNSRLSFKILDDPEFLLLEIKNAIFEELYEDVRTKEHCFSARFKNIKPNQIIYYSKKFITLSVRETPKLSESTVSSTLQRFRVRVKTSYYKEKCNHKYKFIEILSKNCNIQKDKEHKDPENKSIRMDMRKIDVDNENHDTEFTVFYTSSPMHSNFLKRRIRFDEFQKSAMSEPEICLTRLHDQTKEIPYEFLRHDLNLICFSSILALLISTNHTNESNTIPYSIDSDIQNTIIEDGKADKAGINTDIDSSTDLSPMEMPEIKLQKNSTQVAHNHEMITSVSKINEIRRHSIDFANTSIYFESHVGSQKITNPGLCFDCHNIHGQVTIHFEKSKIFKNQPDLNGDPEKMSILGDKNNVCVELKKIRVYYTLCTVDSGRETNQSKKIGCMYSKENLFCLDQKITIGETTNNKNIVVPGEDNIADQNDETIIFFEFQKTSKFDDSYSFNPNLYLNKTTCCVFPRFGIKFYNLDDVVLFRSGNEDKITTMNETEMHLNKFCSTPLSINCISRLGIIKFLFFDRFEAPIKRADSRNEIQISKKDFPHTNVNNFEMLLNPKKIETNSDHPQQAFENFAISDKFFMTHNYDYQARAKVNGYSFLENQTKIKSNKLRSKKFNELSKIRNDECTYNKRGMKITRKMIEKSRPHTEIRSSSPDTEPMTDKKCSIKRKSGSKTFTSLKTFDECINETISKNIADMCKKLTKECKIPIHQKNKYLQLYLELASIYEYIKTEKTDMLTSAQHAAMQKIMIELFDIAEETAELYKVKENNGIVAEEAAKFERIRRKAISLGLKSLMQFNPKCAFRSQKIIIFETIKYILELELKNDSLRNLLQKRSENEKKAPYTKDQKQANSKR